MDKPEAGPAESSGEPAVQGPHYGRYVGLLAVVILILITVNTIVTKPTGDSGIAPGATAPPFAVPLALAGLSGAADVATVAGKGARVAACKERGAEILNICELYEQGPVVLALFVENGSCPDVLSEMQSLVGQFPEVRFAAVAMKGERGPVRRIVDKRHLTFPVGLDIEGDLAVLYKVATCPQLTFVQRGGKVQGRALLNRPSPAALRARVAALVAAPATGPGAG